MTKEEALKKLIEDFNKGIQGCDTLCIELSCPACPLRKNICYDYDYSEPHHRNKIIEYYNKCIMERKLKEFLEIL